MLRCHYKANRCSPFLGAEVRQDCHQQVGGEVVDQHVPSSPNTTTPNWYALIVTSTYITDEGHRSLKCKASISCVDPGRHWWVLTPHWPILITAQALLPVPPLHLVKGMCGVQGGAYRQLVCRVQDCYMTLHLPPHVRKGLCRTHSLQVSSGLASRLSSDLSRLRRQGLLHQELSCLSSSTFQDCFTIPCTIARGCMLSALLAACPSKAP